MGVVVKATLLVVAVQFSIQDVEGRLFETALDTCISSMVREQSLKGLKDKLPKDFSSWQPSLLESVMYWAEKQIFPVKGGCREFSEERFKNVIKEVYGRSLVINLAIKVSIIGWKTAFLHEAVLFLLVSDAVESLFEYFDYTTFGKVVGAVLSTFIGGVIGHALWREKMPPPVATALGMGLGLLPWIYCETRLESIARLLGNENYYIHELTKIVINK